MATLLPFGKEDLCVLKAFHMEMLSKLCRKNEFKLVRALMINMFYNREFPQNHNVRFLSETNNKIDVWDGQQWKSLPREDVLFDVMHSVEIARAMHREKTLLFEFLNEVKRLNGNVPDPAFLEDLFKKCDREQEIMSLLEQTPRRCAQRTYTREPNKLRKILDAQLGNIHALVPAAQTSP